MTNKEINELLEGAKNVFEGLVIVGVKANGSLDLRTSLGDFFQIQGVLNEASQELFLYKKQSQLDQQAKDTPEVKDTMEVEEAKE